tara:strand:+ start:1108 stop:1293 length:186 start_codon:yes stop_codon:yes gene_type:complete
MLDPDEATRSYFDLMAETKKKTDASCSRASEDIKETLKTISSGSSKMKNLLAKLKAERENN